MKYRMLAPGPTPVPDRVLRAMSRTIVHHRTPAFEKVFQECRTGLGWLLDTDNEVLVLSASGTGAFEAALVNFFSRGDQIICVGGGKFAERWAAMAKIFGLEVVLLDVAWGEAAAIEEVDSLLKEYPATKGVICVACETSTGVRHPYEEIGRAVASLNDCLFVVDGITAMGVWDMVPHRDNIDILVGGSQKAFMMPPGLGFLAVSEKAWRRNGNSGMPRYYFDLGKERKAQQKNQSAYTPAVSLMVGLAESLAMMQEEGREKIFARHKRLAAGVRVAMGALGLQIFAQSPSESVTSVCVPEGIREDGIYRGLRDRANLTIANGQDKLKGKIFRIAHLGYFDDLDILTLLAALEIILKQEGYHNFAPGASIAAATEVLAEGFIGG